MVWASAWQNQQNGMCTQRRLRSVWTSAQSDQSLRWALNGLLRTQAFFMRTAKTDQTGQMSRLIWFFARRTCHFVGFVMRCLIYVDKCLHSDRKQNKTKKKKKAYLCLETISCYTYPEPSPYYYLVYLRQDSKTPGCVQWSVAAICEYANICKLSDQL